MRGEQNDWPKLMVRLPPDAKAWLEGQADRYGNNQNSEKNYKEQKTSHCTLTPELRGAAKRLPLE